MRAELGIGKLMLGIWLFVMMALPNTASWIKIGLLLILVLYALYAGGLQFHRRFLMAVIIWEVFFAVFYMHALANHFTFSFTLFEIYFLRPLFLLVLCEYSGTRETIQTIRKILMLTAAYIEIYNLLFFLQTWKVLPELISDHTALTMISDDFMTMRVSNQTAFIFLVPYLSYLYFARKAFDQRERRVISVLYFTGIVVALLSGRRILQLICVVCLFVHGMHTWKRKVIARKFVKQMGILVGMLLVATVFAVIFYKEYDFHLLSAVSNTIQNAFDPADPSVRIRSKQFELLMKDWLKKPLWGWGLSAYNKEYYIYKYHLTGRLETSGDLWSYEFFYIALLYQIGIIGVLLVCFIIYRVLKKIRLFLKSCKEEQLAVCSKAVLCGAIAFFVAGFTNPMITSIWFWFLLLCIYSYVLEY